MAKKILFAGFILLLMPALALARPADPSRLPQVRPLQPAPAGISPNYQGSVNSSLEPGQAPGQEENNSAEAPGSSQTGQGQFNLGQSSPAPSPVLAGAKAGGIALFVVFALILAYVLWRKIIRKP